MAGVVLLGNARLVNLIAKIRSGNQSVLNQDETAKGIVEALQPVSHHPVLDSPMPFKPTCISLFLTTDCTMRCRYCYAEGGKSRIEMPWNMVTDVLNEIAANARELKSNRVTVHFHGGGDLGAAWPLLEKTMAYAKELTARQKILLKTSAGINGYLDDAQRDWLMENIDEATVSIDGPPDIQNFHRPLADGGPSFPEVYETLKKFDKNGYPYGIRCTVSRASVSKMEDIVTFFCRSFAARKIKIEPLFPRGRAVGNQLKPPGAVTFVRHFRKAQKIARACQKDLVYSGARLDTIASFFCQATGLSCALTPEGYVTSCYEVLAPDDSLAETFFYGRYDPGARRLKIDEEKRRGLWQLSVTHKPHCANCFCKWNCAGDCAVKSLYRERNPFADLPDRCYINRELTKDQLLAVIKQKAAKSPLKPKPENMLSAMEET